MEELLGLAKNTLHRAGTLRQHSFLVKHGQSTWSTYVTGRTDEKNVFV